jgi:hypothetical protein
MRRPSRSDAPAPIWNVTRGHEHATTFVSVVWATDGPRFAAVAATEEDCLAQIARYVIEQAQWQLWPPSAARVATLLAAGDQAGAVTEYFGHVGERWDAEWLTTARLGLGPASGVWSGGLPCLSAPRPPEGLRKGFARRHARPQGGCRNDEVLVRPRARR